MAHNVYRRPAGLAFWIALFGLFPTPGTTQSGPVEPGPVEFEASRVAWSRLEFKASKLGVSAHSEVEIESPPASAASAELITPGDKGNGLAPRGAGSLLLKLRTRVLGQDSRVRFWFDPANAMAFQRSELSASKKRLRHKTYRYTREGVFALTRKPVEDEDEQPYKTWSDTSGKFDAYPEDFDGQTVVTEPSALLYIVPASDLSAPGDEIRVHVFSKGRVTPVSVRVEASERIEVEYIEASGSGARTVRGKVEALRVVLRPLAPEGESEKGEFKLLGLEGDIDLFLEPETRAPLRVDGKIKIVGGVRLRLQRAILK